MASLERDIKLLEDELNRFREQTAAVERDRRSEVTRQGDLLKSQERQMKERVRQKNVFWTRGEENKFTNEAAEIPFACMHASVDVRLDHGMGLASPSFIHPPPNR